MLPWPGWVGRGADERNHRCIGCDVPLPGTDSAPRPVTPPIAARRVWLRGRGPWVTLRWPRRADLTPAGPAEGCRSGRTGRSRKPLYLMGTVGSNPTPSASKSLNSWNLRSGFELSVRLAADCGAQRRRPRQRDRERTCRRPYPSTGACFLCRLFSRYPSRHGSPGPELPMATLLLPIKA